MVLKNFTIYLLFACLGLCLPNTATAQSCNLSEYNFADMETNMGIWQDGGSDCTRITNPDGSSSIRLRDNSSSSFTVTENIDFSGASTAEVSFSYIPESMENLEDFFLEYSTDGGSSYAIAQSWASGIDFQNNDRKNVSVTINAAFTANTLFRFRCDASTNLDKIYLDNIKISSCSGGNPPTFDCPSLSLNIGDACDDGDANTENDTVLADCSCAGTVIPPTFDCPSLSLNIGDACDDGDANTENDTVQSNCACAGTVISNPCNGFVTVCEANVNDNGYSTLANCNITVTVGDKLILSANPNGAISYAWSGPNNFTASGDAGGNVLVDNSMELNQAGTYTVAITDANGCVETAAIEVTVEENACNFYYGTGAYVNGTYNWLGSGDGQITVAEGDKLDVLVDPSNAASYFWTSPNGWTGWANNYLIVSESIQQDLAGTYTVAITDANGCVETAAIEVTVTPTKCSLANHHDWESGYGFWNDGGGDSRLLSGTGWQVAELRDNSGAASSIHTGSLNYTGLTKVEIDFLVRFESMERGEDLLLEYSLDGGTSFQVAHQWISGQNIQNSSDFSNIIVDIEADFSAQTQFRFRCDASTNFDRVYIDDIKLSTCYAVTVDPYADQRPTYRTLDGTLNNFENPQFGTVGIPLFREIPAQYGDGVASLAGPNRPSPRHISNQLSDEPQDRRDERLLSGMAYQFGQFLDHDIVITEGGREFAPITVPDYDPIFAGNGIIPFTRSEADFSSGVREQVNNLTSYIDASNVYGVDNERGAWLRTFQDGKLKTSKGNLLPYNTIDGEWDSPLDLTAPRMELDEERDGTRRKLAVAGDFRANEHPNLTAFHLLFVREHNRLCDHLKSQGENDDEIIYQKARKLVGAMMQRIVFEEFIPAFGVSLDRYKGYNPNARPDVRNTFATAAYRWHTMVENDIILRNDACEGIGGVELPLKTIFSNPEIIRSYGPGVLLRGLAFHPQYRTDLKINNGLRNFLLGQGSGLDLVSINIQRGRDHGLPDYKTTRLYYGGSHISSFSDINSDSEISGRMEKVYDNVQDVDLWVGMFAEPLVSGTSLPATAIGIMKKQFEGMRDGDFYYYKNDPFLSSSDLSIIENSGLAHIIERNTSARSMPSDIFFKPPCDDSDPLEDLNDHSGTPVCTSSGATFITSCSGISGSSRVVGYYNSETSVRQIKVNLGYAVRIYNKQGEFAYYTDDTGCLPSNFSANNIASIEVVCLSNDDSTVDCSSFAGALFTECWGSPSPITTTGQFNTEQLKSLAISDDDVEGLRVNDGFMVTLYSDDHFQGHSQVFYGPTVICLSSLLSNHVSSMEAVCISDPDRSNCGFNGVAGAVFPNSSGDSENPGPNDHIGTSLGPGDFNQARLRDMGLKDNDIEKVSVNNGYAITLFEHDHFQGNYRVYLGDESDLSSAITETLYYSWDIFKLFPYTNTISLDNGTSSIKVSCIEGLSTNHVAAKSSLSLGAEKKTSSVELSVTHSLTKEAEFVTVQKFDGRTGTFESIEDIIVEQLASSFTVLDNEVKEGDNVYRATVFYVDGSEEDTELKIVRFNANKLYNIFPNPAINVLNVDMKEYIGTNVDISIYNILGTELSSQRYNDLQEPTITFDLTDVVPGAYIIRVDSEGRRAISKKFSVIKP